MIPPIRRDGTVDPAVPYIQPYYLLPLDGRHTVTIAANGASNQILFEGPQEGAFEGAMLLGTATSPLILVTQFEHRNRNLIVRPIHAATMFGGQIVPTGLATLGVSPFYMQETLWLLPRERLVINLMDLSGSENTVRLAIAGTLYVLAGSEAARQMIGGVSQLALRKSQISLPFWYTPEPTAGELSIVLAASATMQGNILISSEAAFNWKKTTSYHDYPYEITFYEPFSGRPLSPAPVHCDLITGTGMFPFVSKEGLFLKPSSRLNFTITNLSATHENAIFLTLHGQHIYSGLETVL